MILSSITILNFQSSSDFYDPWWDCFIFPALVTPKQAKLKNHTLQKFHIWDGCETIVTNLTEYQNQDSYFQTRLLLSPQITLTILSFFLFFFFSFLFFFFLMMIMIRTVCFFFKCRKVCCFFNAIILTEVNLNSFTFKLRKNQGKKLLEQLQT